MSDNPALAAMYPSTVASEPVQAAPASSVAAQASAAASGPAPSTERQPRRPEPEPDPDAFARKLYGHGAVPTREPVRWDEAAARDGSQIRFTLPLGELDRTDAGDAERAKLAAAMAHAGAGNSIANELYRDVIAASRPNYAPATPDAGLAGLREAWGSGFDANLTAARALVAKAAQKDPSIIPYLERTGLGNDPAFIRKIAARAAKLRTK